MIASWPVSVAPTFSLPLADAGNGAVDTSITIGLGFFDSIGNPVTTAFTRATTAAARLSTGLWNLGVAINVARSHYLANGAYGGLLSESAATQLALNPRDLTQAAWVAVNVTAAQTSTGIDGVALSCTRLTAGAIGGAVLQTITAVASTRTFSAYVKRVTGTGTVTMNHLNASLDITALINSSTFTLVQLSASKLNATLGFTFSVSGDAIDVDCAQFEAGAFATTPIPAAGTRGADLLLSVRPLTLSTALGASYCVFSTEFATAPHDAVVLSNAGIDGLLAYIPSGAVSTHLDSFDGTNEPTVTSSDAQNTLKPCACSWGADFNIVTGSTTNTTVFDGLLGGAFEAIGIGCDPSGAGKELNGTVKDVKIWTQQLPIGYLSSISQ